MRRVLLLVCLLPGCSFPDPSITDEPLTDTSVVMDSSGEVAVEETSIADSATSDASKDVAADAKADAPDVFVCASPDPCDCDGDGDQAKRTGCPGGSDCDDGDSRRNSKVNSFQSHTLNGTEGHAGDWDCSNSVTREYDVGVTCAGLLIGDCSKQGYKEATVTCGQEATFIRCKWDTIACVADPAATTKLVVKCK